MRSDGPHITVGTNWITVCNGVWHAIFLADDSSMYPGSCSCEVDSGLSGIVKKLDAALSPESTKSGDERPI